MLGLLLAKTTGLRRKQTSVYSRHIIRLHCYDERSKCFPLTLYTLADDVATDDLRMHDGVAHSVKSREYYVRVYCISNVSLAKQRECLSPPTYFEASNSFYDPAPYGGSIKR